MSEVEYKGVRASKPHIKVGADISALRAEVVEHINKNFFMLMGFDYWDISAQDVEAVLSYTIFESLRFAQNNYPDHGMDYRAFIVYVAKRWARNYRAFEAALERRVREDAEQRERERQALPWWKRMWTRRITYG